MHLALDQTLSPHLMYGMYIVNKWKRYYINQIPNQITESRLTQISVDETTLIGVISVNDLKLQTVALLESIPRSL